jgi:hypothetical protein
VDLAATIRLSRVEPVYPRGRRFGRYTKVTLPDGRSVVFVGPLGKREGVRQALRHFAPKPPALIGG